MILESMPNIEQNFFDAKIARSIPRIEKELVDSHAECLVELLGVAHSWHPGKKILAKVQDADVVTLELTRGVVKESLQGKSSRLLGRNRFWQKVIEVAKTDAGKMVRGIEVNQTFRVAWKRLHLHNGLSVLASAPFTVEVDSETVPELTNLLLPDDFKKFDSYGWLTTDDLQVYAAVITRVNDSLKGDHNFPLHPLPLWQGVNLVSLDYESFKRGDHLITFIKPPNSSLVKAQEIIREQLAKTECDLSEEELRKVSSFALLDFLLARVELTDAEEIIYALDQYCKRSCLSGKNNHLLHIGGGAHRDSIFRILRLVLTPYSDTIHLLAAMDPRMSEGKGDIWRLFKDALPFEQRLAAVGIKDGEVEIDQERLFQTVGSVLTEYREDFYKRVLVRRILGKTHPQSSTLKDYSSMVKERDRLYQLDVSELEDRSGEN